MAKFETALEGHDFNALAGNGFQVSEERNYGYVVLRIRPNTAGAAEALTQLGIQLPNALGITGALDTKLVKWLSPDEYLITLPLSQKDAFIKDAKAALHGIFAAVVDNSGGYSLLKLSGEHVYEVLAKNCVYDCSKFLSEGKVISTLFSKAAAVIYRIDANNVYLMVRWSFADYVFQALAISSREFR
ncbi:sarcosine oxidase subunit gamma [uncultured Thiothrix sp.]|uniref:sarcosine oxidase subunit gamma n=1 Tax=uncultured Thiothrix sp. TaxID=223185 RepID=UPI00261DE70C|nr:sarcosine oxidase subunit gamma family protein [uncultured Thiothrix sp.]